MINSFVALPAEAQIAIQALIGALVVFVIQWVIARVPFLAFLAAYAQEWGMLLSAVVLDALQNALPTGYEDASIKGVLFLLALIGTFYKYARSKGVQGFV